MAAKDIGRESRRRLIGALSVIRGEPSCSAGTAVMGDWDIALLVQ
jgi:hypothetical protein